MPLFTETVSLSSALPPDALLDRIRRLAAGTLPMPPPPRWRSPVRWSLREEPRAVRLMPLFPPSFNALQPSFVGTIDPEGRGSAVRGRIRPYGLTVWLTAFLVLAIAAMSTAGVVQQLSRHGPSQAMPFVVMAIGVGAAAALMLRASVRFAAVPIRQLLETAAARESHAIENGIVEPAAAIVPETRKRSAARGVLWLAAAIDALIALLSITTSVVSSRIGRPAALVLAVVLAFGAGLLGVIANRLSKR